MGLHARIVTGMLLATVVLTACGGAADDRAAAPPHDAGDVDMEFAEEPADDTAEADIAYDMSGVHDDEIEVPGEIEEPGGIETVVFEDHGVSDWIVTADQPTSTFQTDADVASFRIAESWLASGVLPPTHGIRAEEWINALDHDHPAPAGGEVWRITADAGTPWWQTGPDSPGDTSSCASA